MSAAVVNVIRIDSAQVGGDIGCGVGLEYDLKKTEQKRKTYKRMGCARLVK
jgi:hypothetical protein